MRRLAITLLIAPFAGLVGLSLLGSTAGAAGTVPTDPPSTQAPAASGEGGVAPDLAPVDVLQVSGLFDPVTVQSIEDAIDESEASGSQALILQLSSGGAIVSEAEMTRLLQKVADAKVAIGIWVGPSRDDHVYGLPAQLFGVADVTAMVPGSRLGYTGPLLPLAGEQQVDLGAGADQLRNGSLSFAEARTLGVLRPTEIEDEGVPTVRSMLAIMDGVQLNDGTVLDTVTEQLNDQGDTELTATLVRFSSLGLIEEMFHTIASPPMAFLFFVIGCCLLIFEFFTAGVGVAGFVGAVLAIFGCFGFSALPTRPAAIALLVLAMLAFAIDVQVGIPRFWTGVGAVLFVLGSWFLYEPLPGTDLRLSWITLFVGVAGVLLTFVVGMPSMVRTRFATPTIGRDWMIGSAGVAIGAIDPEGVAQVGAAKWRARTNRATPLVAGAELRVVAIDGVTLEVEPLEGAARDYRERRAK
ncbi:MAG: NfeD family protein [Actinomycetota bacterium]|nr:NfeD family protein [Actinomycetota bacterium]